MPHHGEAVLYKIYIKHVFAIKFEHITDEIVYITQKTSRTRLKCTAYRQYIEHTEDQENKQENK